MKKLRNILATAFLSTQVLGSDIISSPTSQNGSSLTIEEVFKSNIVKCIPQSNIARLHVDQDLGLSILAYLTAEDLQSWIKAFASLVPNTSEPRDTSERREFIRSMNINFFGAFYPRTDIPRILRPTGAPLAYVAFSREKMSKLLSDFTFTELQNLLVPFLNNPTLSQRDPFFQPIFFFPSTNISKNIADFLKDPSGEDIPGSLNSLFISILGKAIENDGISLAEVTTRPVNAFYNILRELQDDDEPWEFAADLEEDSEQHKKLKAFVNLCLMENCASSPLERIESAYKAQTIHPDLSEEVAKWFVSIINDQNAEIKKRVIAIRYLSYLAAKPRCELVSGTGPSMHDVDVDMREEDYKTEIVKAYRSILEDQSLDVRDKHTIKSLLMDIWEDDISMDNNFMQRVTEISEQYLPAHNDDDEPSEDDYEPFEIYLW